MASSWQRFMSGMDTLCLLYLLVCSVCMYVNSRFLFCLPRVYARSCERMSVSAIIHVLLLGTN